MAALARAKGVLGVVGTQAPFAPEIEYLKYLIADGFVGEVLSTTLVARDGPMNKVFANAMSLVIGVNGEVCEIGNIGKVRKGARDTDQALTIPSRDSEIGIIEHALEYACMKGEFGTFLLCALELCPNFFSSTTRNEHHGVTPPLPWGLRISVSITAALSHWR